MLSFFPPSSFPFPMRNCRATFLPSIAPLHQSPRRLHQPLRHKGLMYVCLAACRAVPRHDPCVVLCCRGISFSGSLAAGQHFAVRPIFPSGGGGTSHPGVVGRFGGSSVLRVATLCARVVCCCSCFGVRPRFFGLPAFPPSATKKNIRLLDAAYSARSRWRHHQPDCQAQ